MNSDVISIGTPREAWEHFHDGELAQDDDGRLWSCGHDGRNLTLTPIDSREGQPGMRVNSAGRFLLLEEEPRWPIYRVEIATGDVRIPPAYVAANGDGYMFLRCPKCLRRIIGDVDGWNLDDLVDEARKHKPTCGQPENEDDDDE